MDILLITWYLFTIAYAYVQPTYPVASEILRMTLLISLYFSLRIILSSFKYKTYYIVLLVIMVCLAEALLGIYQYYVGFANLL